MTQKKAISNKSKKTKIPSKIPILKTSELPATQLMLTTLRKQIKSEINSLEKKLDSKFNQVDSQFSQVESRFSQVESRFNQVESRFNQVDSKISQVESKINQVDSKIELVLAEMHRMAILVEEQNSKNNFVLDGYASLYERQDRLELRFDAHEKNIEDLILKRNVSK